ncbi:MAG TPA: glycoside hydrolase family 19 protein [Thiomonas arsenitoxydans]|uniref:glycoside hydrolase family 19 protein n=1 Tax=Thiomonas arsenitoxydans (strain DSM 22701 / CIP 110005 / 3As) TaxID=426114 RepID=UPI002CB6FC48|nr:glycoside hydrolase family 19 protein [Thiomonas arsenitoxydans]HML83173.1 glycoside hydrolase family 19 protein [Thiomonas arsenitoxydans]
MLTAFIDRITGFLRRADHARDATKMTPLERAPLISPITIGLLEALGIRHALAVQWLPHISEAAHRYQIDANPRRVAAWLATIAHESARLTTLVENLNYSAEGLARTWPARYADITGQPTQFAHKIARDPERIANHAYANRLGNGSAGSGDGWKYRGRGLIQITGRDNYARSGAELGLDLIARPEQLEQPFLAALSAAEWWSRNGCNQLADTGDMAAVTRRVNGGLNGLDDRLKLYSAALRYLGSA